MNRSHEGGGVWRSVVEEAPFSPHTSFASADKPSEAMEKHAVYKVSTTVQGHQRPRSVRALVATSFVAGQEKLRASFWTEESGQTLVLAAVCMLVLVGFLGLSIDAGVLRYQKRLLQNVADAAALAGSLEIAACGTTANCSAMQTAAQDALTENGFTGSTLLKNCATSTSSKLTITLNNPPCAISTDANKGNDSYVEVVVSEPVSTVFASLLGVKTVTIAARAEATQAASPCVYFLSLDYTGASLSATNQTIQAACTFYMGLSYSLTGGASSTGSTFLVAGSASSSTGTVTPTATFNSATLANPLSTLSAPTYSSCTYTNYKVTAAASLQPGTYCGGLTIDTSSNVTLASGTYIILGALSINGPTLTGSGVTFYLSQNSKYSYGASSIQNVNATLSAPTSGSLQGILYFSDPSLPAGDAELSLQNWNPGTRLDGILYLPGQELYVSNVTLEGNAYFGVVADYCAMNNTSFLPSTDYSSLSNGTPFSSVKTGVAVVQ